MDAPFITLGDFADSELVEKKSRFIGHAGHVGSEDEALAYIESIRHKYADARHNVYAYLLKENNIMRFSDDKEPQGSAGIPVLDVLRKTGVTDAAIVVTRYFGGVLLGVGGLVRAYSAAAKAALDASGIIRYEAFENYTICCDYRFHTLLCAILTRYEAYTQDVDFTDSVKMTVSVPKDISYKFVEEIKELSAGQARIDTGKSEYKVRKNNN